MSRKKERKPQRPDVNFYLLLEKLLSRRILIAVLNSLKLPRAVLQMFNYVIYRSAQKKRKKRKKKTSLPADVFS